MTWSEGARLAQALSNEHYRGRAFGWIFLLLMAAMNLFRGSIHLFKSDGGAASIAGIDLLLNGEVIVMLFAGMGLGQLLMAVIDVAVALRRREAHSHEKSGALPEGAL